MTTTRGRDPFAEARRFRLVPRALVLAGLALVMSGCAQQQKWIFFKAGTLAAEVGADDMALKDFTDAIQFDSHFEKAYVSRGNIYVKKHDYARASADFSQAIQINPKNEYAFFLRAWVYDNENNYPKAIADYSQIIQLNPKSTDAYNDRANDYSQQDNYAGAVADYSRVIQINPGQVEGYSSRGNAYEQNGDYTNALANFTQAVRLDPQNATAANDLAWLLAICPQASLRNGAKAVQEATAACTLSEWNEPNYVDTLAAADAETGDFAGAVKWETQYLASPDLTASDIADAKSRLALYQAGQPYHADK